MAGLILLQDLNERDLEWLVEMAKLDYGGSSAKDLLKAWWGGKCQLWRFDDGLVMTEIIIHARKKEFYIWGIVGEGLWKIRKSMPRAFELYAKERGCSLIGANALDPRLGKYLETVVGGRPWATKYLKEI